MKPGIGKYALAAVLFVHAGACVENGASRTPATACSGISDGELSRTIDRAGRIARPEAESQLRSVVTQLDESRGEPRCFRMRQVARRAHAALALALDQVERAIADLTANLFDSEEHLLRARGQLTEEEMADEIERLRPDEDLTYSIVVDRPTDAAAVRLALT